MAEEGIGWLEALGVDDVLVGIADGVGTFEGLVCRTSGVLSAIDVGYLCSGVAARSGTMVSEGAVMETGEAVILF